MSPQYSDFFLPQRLTVEQAFVSSEVLTYMCDTLGMENWKIDLS